MRVNENMLFNMQEDPGETTNIKEKHSEIFEKLKQTVDNYDTIESKQEVLPYEDGKKGFKAPREWNIEDYPE